MTTRAASLWALLTIDRYGTVVSASGAATVFGVAPKELVQCPIQQLVHGVLPIVLAEPEEAPRGGKSTATAQATATSSCVVTGARRDGSLVPLLLTSACVKGTLHALLFEIIQGAVLTLDAAGVIQGATESASSLLSVPDLCGRALSSLCADPSADPVKHSLFAGSLNCHSSLGGLVDVSVLGVGQDKPVMRVMQVLDLRNRLCTVAVYKDRASVAHAPEGSTCDSSSCSCTRAALSALLADGWCQGLEVEDVLGPYTVLAQPLGRRVRQGVHRLTGVLLAIKTLKASEEDAASGREVSLMQLLHHPNLVKLYDVMVSADQTTHLVLEHMPGGSLLQLCVERGALQEAEARRLYRDLVGALDYLHRKGIVHRDVKLESCLLDASHTHLKLGDFATAAVHLSGPLLSSSVSVSHAYAAPEMFGLSHGPAADVWASGVVLFAMLTSEYPFNNVEASMEAHYFFPRHTLVQLSACVTELVRHIFQRNPQHRLTISQLRRHEWLNSGYANPVPRVPIDKSKTHAASQPVKRDTAVFLRADLLVLAETELGLPADAVIESRLADEVNLFSAAYKILETKHPRPVLGIDGEKLHLVRLAVQDVQLRAQNPRATGPPRHGLPAIRRSVTQPGQRVPLSDAEQQRSMLEEYVAAKLGGLIPTRTPHSNDGSDQDEHNAASEGASPLTRPPPPLQLQPPSRTLAKGVTPVVRERSASAEGRAAAANAALVAAQKSLDMANK